MINEEILRVEHLSVWILSEKRKIPILYDLSFTIREGERWALAGESGAGKTMTISAITALLPEGSTVVEGKILYRQTDGTFVDLLSIPYKKRQAFIARQVAIIFQDSINALNPNERIRKQWMETVRLHHPEMTKEEGISHMLERMEIFQVRGGRETLNKYPHQLSGGMRQRIAIAMALESPARILIADEPTTSLDAITQRNTVDFIGKLCVSSGRTLLYISHNLGILQYICDHVMVLKDGRMVEQGTADEIFFQGKEEYTRTLVRETMKIMGRKDGRPELFGVQDRAESDNAESNNAVSNKAVTDKAVTDKAVKNHVVSDNAISDSRAADSSAGEKSDSRAETGKNPVPDRGSEIGTENGTEEKEDAESGHRDA